MPGLAKWVSQCSSPGADLARLDANRNAQTARQMVTKELAFIRPGFSGTPAVKQKEERGTIMKRLRPRGASTTLPLNSETAVPINRDRSPKRWRAARKR